MIAFALDELRRVHGQASEGADPLHDTGPFRAFRSLFLAAAARTAVAPADLSMWWEGTFNGYSLVVQIWPAEAVAGLPDAIAACGAPESVRLAPPRNDGYPLARLTPGSFTLARGDGGILFEAPFGAATGHFGAPGMRRIS